MVSTAGSTAPQSSENPSVELARADDLGGSVSTEETVYTSTLGENLLQVNVSVSNQASGQTAVHSTPGESFVSGSV